MHKHFDPSSPAAGLVLLSRADCDLCEEFLADLRAFAQRFVLPQVSVIDVDEHPALAQRHGLDIPVLLWDGIKVCQHRLDQDELRRLLRPRQAAPPL